MEYNLHTRIPIASIAYSRDLDLCMNTYRYILFDASTRKDAMQFGTEVALAEQGEHNRFSNHALQCMIAMSLSVDTQQNLLSRVNKLAYC